MVEPAGYGSLPLLLLALIGQHGAQRSDAPGGDLKRSQAQQGDTLLGGSGAAVFRIEPETLPVICSCWRWITGRQKLCAALLPNKKNPAPTGEGWAIKQLRQEPMFLR